MRPRMKDAKEMAMATKVAKIGVERESGWLYYLDKKGDVSRVRMARGGGKARKTEPQMVAKASAKASRRTTAKRKSARGR